MIRKGSAHIDESRVIELYLHALSPTTRRVDMGRIEGYLRRFRIEVTPKGGESEPTPPDPPDPPDPPGPP